MKRIFLVEDDREIAKNLALLLRAEGFAVTHAGTQSEAVRVVSEERFDLVQAAIEKVANGQDLTEYEAKDVMDCLLSGRATQAQIGAFLTALRLVHHRQHQLLLGLLPQRPGGTSAASQQ